MNAKKMLLEKDCQIIETSWGLWIDTNASKDPGQERLCMLDKREKKILWQLDNKNLDLDFEMIRILYKLCDELGWNK